MPVPTHTHAICNILYDHFLRPLYHCATSSTSSLIRSLFSEFSTQAYSFMGYNFLYGHQSVRIYDDNDYVFVDSLYQKYGQFTQFKTCTH